MSNGGVPEGRCGFVLEPGDVHEDVADQYESGSEWWHVDSNAVCCWREEWDRTDDGRCIWHANTDDKPKDALIESRANVPERLDGAYVPAVNLGGAINFDECGLYAATFDGTGLRGTGFAKVGGAFIRFLDTDLTDTRFPNANLRQAQFQSAHLLRAQFPDAHLTQAEFRETNLWYAQFPDADLQGIRFPSADLFNAQFSETNLIGAKFPNARLYSSDLSDVDATVATFTGATLERATLTNADLSNADLTDARLRETRPLDTRITAGTTINEVAPEEADADWFAAADLSITDRLRWWWTWWRADPDSLEAHHKQLDRAHTVYRTIQRLYRENSMPEEIDEYHVRAKDVRRKQAIIDSDWLRWLYLAGQRWVMRYGERPRRVVYTSLVTIGLGALLYPIPGIQPSGTSPPLTYPRLVAEWPGSLLETARVLGESVYFSTVTFTTLGYGDVAPVGWGKALATVESFVGALLMALLVYVLGRRATR